ncbi:MAG: peptide MFS transporter [Bacteroidota bacterium]
MSTVPTPQTWGHPRGLFYLFFAELWERFSFYGMRALLTLYMTKQLLFTDDMSFGIYAAYMSLVYITPTFGGLIADRIIGYRKGIILGGILMALGHFLLTFESPIFFYTSLAFIIVGNGFFKPNISSMVGRLYEAGDERRDAGFTIFYMGVNIGGAVAPLLCAWLAELYGWHYGFVLAGIGMLVGLVFFFRGTQQNVFGQEGLAPDPVAYQERWWGLDKGAQVTIGAFLSVPPVAALIYFYEFEHYLVWVVTFLLIFAMVWIYRSCNRVEQERLLVVAYFTVLATLFWAIFEQAGSSLTLFADRNVRLIGLNAAQTNSINSTFIILLAIPFSALWSHLSRRNINPNSAVKFGIGLILLGLGFVCFGFSARQMDELAQTPMFYLILGYFILTVGELFLSPIGLSKMTELSPAKYVAFMMGVWFSSNFFGHFFAGKIAQLTTVREGVANPLSEGMLGQLVELVTGMEAAGLSAMASDFQQLYSYVSVYAVLGLLSMFIGLLALLLSPWIKDWMNGIN